MRQSRDIPSQGLLSWAVGQLEFPGSGTWALCRHDPIYGLHRAMLGVADIGAGTGATSGTAGVCGFGVTGIAGMTGRGCGSCADLAGAGSGTEM